MSDIALFLSSYSPSSKYFSKAIFVVFSVSQNSDSDSEPISELTYQLKN